MRVSTLVAALLGATVLTATTAAAQEAGAPARGTPPITDQTKLSGGVRPAEQAPLRLDHVDLAIEVFPDRYRIAGVATLTLINNGDAPVPRLLIDLDKNLPVSAVTIDDRALAAGSWTNPEGQLAIPLAEPLAAGASVVAKITYGGTPHVAVRAPWDDGFVWATTPDGAPWIATTSEGYGCDLYWPCLDFPRGEPKTVDLHVTVPSSLSVAAGGTLTGKDALADGRTTWNWHANSPNPYSVALNIAPYKVISAEYHSRYGNSFPIQFWHLPERAEQARALFDREFTETIDFYESMIGPYPWGDEKLAIVETPHLGMEHQTMNAYGANFRRNPNGFDDLFQHELGHEWFGNQLTAANWDDYWLHEGYTQYMQPLYGLWREGQARYDIMMGQFRTGIENRFPIVSGEVKTEEDVYEDGRGPAGDIYVKGAWVLHTLRNLIGDEAFFDVTRRIVYGRPDPRPGNFEPRFGSTDEYVSLVNQVTGKDYGWFFDVYLRQAALPKLVERREGDRLTLRWQTPNDLPFPLPVEVQVNGETRLVAMPGGTATLDVPGDAHVVLDPHARILRQSDAIDAVQAQRSGGGQ